MCNAIRELVRAAEKLAASIDTDVIPPKDLPALLEGCAKGKKIFSALEALVAGRVAASGNWQSEGDKSPAEFVSRKTGETVRESVDLIQTAKALRDLPATDRAFRSGKLTQDQAFEVASAAVVAPKAEDKLLKVAEAEGLTGVRQEALRVKAAAMANQKDLTGRLHRQRYLRTWVDHQGAFKLSAQLSPEAGAEVQAVIDAKVRQLLRSKSASDSRDQVAADALVEVARSSASAGASDRVKAEVKVRVDLEALRRGHLEHGEVCEAEGMPISLTAFGEFLSNSVVKLIGLEGEDVTRVEHLGRYIPPKVNTAVKEKYPKCVIAGCKERVNLELDHTVALGESGKTSVKNLKPLCPKHHRMKHGPYTLIEDPGDGATYRLVKVKQATAWDEFRTDPSPP